MNGDKARRKGRREKKERRRKQRNKKRTKRGLISCTCEGAADHWLPSLLPHFQCTHHRTAPGIMRHGEAKECESHEGREFRVRKRGVIAHPCCTPSPVSSSTMRQLTTKRSMERLYLSPSPAIPLIAFVTKGSTAKRGVV